MQQLEGTTASERIEVLQGQWLSKKEITNNFFTIEKIFQENIPYLYREVKKEIWSIDGPVLENKPIALYTKIAKKCLAFIKEKLQPGIGYFNESLPDEVKREQNGQTEFFNVLGLFSQEQLKEYFEQIISSREQLKAVKDRLLDKIDDETTETMQRQDNIKNILVEAAKGGFLYIVEQIAVIMRQRGGFLSPEGIGDNKPWKEVIKEVVEREDFEEISVLQTIMRNNEVPQFELLLGEAIANRLLISEEVGVATLIICPKCSVKSLLYCLRLLLSKVKGSLYDDLVWNIDAGKQSTKQEEEASRIFQISEILRILETRASNIPDDPEIKNLINNMMSFYYLCRFSSNQLIKMIEIFSSKIEPKNLLQLFERAIRERDLKLVRLLLGKRSDIDFKEFSTEQLFSNIIEPLLQEKSAAKMLEIFLILKIFLEKMMQDSVYEHSCKHFFGMLFVYEKLKHLDVSKDAVEKLGSVFLDEKKIGDNLNKLLHTAQDENVRSFRDSICKLACEYGRFDILLLDKRIWEDQTLAKQIIKAAIQQGAVSVVEHYFNKTAEEFAEIFSREDLAKILCLAMEIRPENGDTLSKMLSLIEDKILSTFSPKDNQTELYACLCKAIMNGNLRVVRKIIKKLYENPNCVYHEWMQDLFYELYSIVFGNSIEVQQQENNLQIVQVVLEFIRWRTPQYIRKYIVCSDFITSFIEGVIKTETYNISDIFDNFKKIVEEIKIAFGFDDGNEIYEMTINYASEVYSRREKALQLITYILQDPQISISGRCLAQVLAQASDDNQIIDQISVSSLWRAILAGQPGCFQIIKRTIMSRKFLYITFPLFWFVPLIGLARYAGRQIMNYFTFQEVDDDEEK